MSFAINIIDNLCLLQQYYMEHNEKDCHDHQCTIRIKFHVHSWLHLLVAEKLAIFEMLFWQLGMCCSGACRCREGLTRVNVWTVRGGHLWGYPGSRGPFSKYLIWNKPCLRFDKAPCLCASLTPLRHERWVSMRKKCRLEPRVLWRLTIFKNFLWENGCTHCKEALKVNITCQMFSNGLFCRNVESSDLH